MLASLSITGRFLLTHPLTRGRPLAAIFRFGRWQIQSRIHRDGLVVPWIEGTRLHVRRGMAGATGNIYAGLHEWPDMAFALHLLRSGDLFVDVGANVGAYAILASGVRRARTIAFEPDPAAAKALRRNVALNNLGPLVQTCQRALGAARGEARFTVGLDTINRVAADGGQTVAMDTLDGALGTDVPILIKLDVEGYESEVLRGARRVLADAQLKAVLTEDHGQTVVSALTVYGFRRYGYDPFMRRLIVCSTADAFEGLGANALFIRDLPFVARRVADAPTVRVLGKDL